MDFSVGDTKKLKKALYEASKFENLGDFAATNAFEVSWAPIAIKRQRYTLEGQSAVVPTTAGKAKIVFHITKVAIHDLSKVAEALALTTQGLDIPGTFAEAGQSPIPQMRNQWDFVLFNVPEINAHNVHSYLREAVSRVLT